MAVKNIAFPSVLAPIQMMVRLKANTRIHVSELTGIPTTVETLGARWEIELQYSELYEDSLANRMVVDAIANIRGQAQRIQVHHMGRPETTGTLDVSNIVNNGNFILGSTGWGEVVGAGGRITLSSGRYRLERASANVDITQTVVNDSGVVYSIHVAVHEGTTDIIQVVLGGTSTNFTGSGRHVKCFTSTGSNSLIVRNITNSSFVSVGDIIVARAALTDGTDQTGTKINIKGLGGVAEDVVKIRDWVTINGELKRVVDVLLSTSGGLGTLVIQPPMHNLAPNNSDVIFNRPFSKYILADDSLPETISHPNFTGFSLNLIEDIS